MRGIEDRLKREWKGWRKRERKGEAEREVSLLLAYVGRPRESPLSRVRGLSVLRDGVRHWCVWTAQSPPYLSHPTPPSVGFSPTWWTT